MFKRNIFELIVMRIYYLMTSVYFLMFHGVRLGKKCKIAFSATLRGNIRLGNNVNIGKFAYLGGNIEIGDNSFVGDFVQLSTMPNGKILIGKECHINSFNIIGSSSRVSIGDYALFAVGVKITDATHGIENVDEIIKNAPITSKEISIGKNCWLGFDVNVIMGGGNWGQLCRRFQVSC